ncbi:RNA-binding motif protein 25 isoform X1 [Arachis duranensis]|uniref:RNA-binding motif protein 25 isoform X1 n=2 Tax=Arachis duranensis TaxID=130453 RepID=A0A6P4CTZ9_ARADU|nr:RNA-binding motif protein 25 isoform X1 [Arachis duranensis]
MADPASSPAVTLEPKPQHTESQPDPAPPSTSLSQSPAPANPNPNPTLLSAPSPAPPLQQHHPTFSYVPPQVSAGPPFAPPAAPSFRPLPPQAPHFSPLPNPSGGAAPPSLAYQNPSIPPPGVSSAAAMAPGVASAAGGVAVPVSVPHMQPMMSYQVPPGQPAIPTLRPPYAMPNGYAAIPGAPQTAVPPAGMSRYPPPYGTMVRPVYPPRVPGAVNVLPVSRPPVAGVPPVRPIIPPVVRPVVAPSVTPAEKPQITVYVGKIAPTVENDFMLSILQLCGPVRSWKRPQDLSNGTPKSFGFCEFETDEGVLRALRLLTKLNIDGQELMLNINETTKEHLKRYVAKKTEDSKKKETQVAGAEKDDEGAQPSDGGGKSDAEDSKKEDSDSHNKESLDFATFGIVTDDDREADREALEKITNMIEERLKTRPLPPPPAQTPGDGSAITSEQPAKTRDGDSDEAMGRNEGNEDKTEKDANSDIKQTSEHDKPETPDRRHDRRSRERDRDRELKREKDRELERYEREAERERIRKEREQRRRIEDAERQYESCLKEWEYREREKEKERQYEKDKEKERERKRRKEILYEEEDEDDDSRKRWRRSVLEEKRKKRLREKEDDLVDRQREEEEIAEAKKKAEEDQQRQQQRDALKLLSDHSINGGEKAMATEEAANEVKNVVTEHNNAVDYNHEGHIGDVNSLNAMNDESAMASVSENDARSSANAPAKKLGFGLVGSGKRTTVPSVFHEEEDDDAHKDKKMRPLVPIDYSTEELQAVQPTAAGPTPPNLAAAAEFAKRISSANLKEEKLDGERDRSKRSSEKSNHRDRDRSDEDGTHNRDDHKEKTDRDRDRDHGLDKVKTSDNKRLLDAKQLIDMIPKTKEELFSYEINWAVYDKHQLHDRMRPWISKKIKEFLGEEENTLIDYIVSSTQEHVKASQMLERLQIILDDEAEMFVLKMWRMLIFEIKKVETGLALRTK